MVLSFLFFSWNTFLIGPSPLNTQEACARSMYVQVRSYSQNHFYMETQTTLAVPDEDGCMNVYTSCQAPDLVQMLISMCLNLPLHNIRVITRRLGGGFGGKVLQNLKVLSAHICTGGCGGSSSVYDEFTPPLKKFISRMSVANLYCLVDLSFDLKILCVGSWLFWIQHLPCSVCFSAHPWRWCGGLNEEHFILVQ